MIKGSQFLGTAQLLSKGPDEAAFRSAVSRAYYACFITIRDIALSKCKSDLRKKLNGQVEHKIMRNSLKVGSREVRGLGTDLNAICTKRVKADYWTDNKTITPEDAKRALADAEALLKSLSTIQHEDIGKALDAYMSLSP